MEKNLLPEFPIREKIKRKGSCWKILPKFNNLSYKEDRNVSLIQQLLHVLEHRIERNIVQYPEEDKNMVYIHNLISKRRIENEFFLLKKNPPSTTFPFPCKNISLAYAIANSRGTTVERERKENWARTKDRRART